jgi:hypothetical protein
MWSVLQLFLPTKCAAGTNGSEKPEFFSWLEEISVCEDIGPAALVLMQGLSSRVLAKMFCARQPSIYPRGGAATGVHGGIGTDVEAVD